MRLYETGTFALSDFHLSETVIETEFQHRELCFGCVGIPGTAKGRPEVNAVYDNGHILISPFFVGLALLPILVSETKEVHGVYFGATEEVKTVEHDLVVISSFRRDYQMYLQPSDQRIDNKEAFLMRSIEKNALNPTTCSVLMFRAKIADDRIDLIILS